MFPSFQGDIFQALEDIGRHQCVAGGIAESFFILSKPAEIRERVKLLCEAAGDDRGLIINGGCNIPYDTRPENYRAMIDAILEFATYDASLKPLPRENGDRAPKPTGSTPKMVTPWEQRRAELGGVKGDEDLIRTPWEQLEAAAYAWVWQWVF